MVVVAAATAEAVVVMAEVVATAVIAKIVVAVEAMAVVALAESEFPPWMMPVDTPPSTHRGSTGTRDHHRLFVSIKYI